MEKNNLRSKKGKIIILAVIVFAVLIISIGLFTFFSDTTYDTTWTGNTYSNIAGKGIVAADGDTLFLASENYLYRVTADGTATRITDYSVTSMVIYEGYLYYINLDADQQIYRMDLETLESECISDIPGGYINIVDDVLYYASLYGTSYSGIYKIDLRSEDGFNPEQITDDWAASLLYYGGRLYFINAIDLNKVYSIQLDGSDRDVSVGRGTSSFTFYEGWLYYGNVSGVFKCKPNGSTRVALSDKRASSVHVVDGYVYHCLLGGSESTGDQEFYRTTIDGTETQVLTSDAATHICYADGYVYFFDVYKGYDLYRISVDNTVFENVAFHYNFS